MGAQPNRGDSSTCSLRLRNTRRMISHLESPLTPTLFQQSSHSFETNSRNQYSSRSCRHCPEESQSSRHVNLSIRDIQPPLVMAENAHIAPSPLSVYDKSTQNPVSPKCQRRRSIELSPHNPCRERRRPQQRQRRKTRTKAKKDPASSIWVCRLCDRPDNKKRFNFCCGCGTTKVEATLERN